jgi:hypothetical protein
MPKILKRTSAYSTPERYSPISRFSHPYGWLPSQWSHPDIDAIEDTKRLAKGRKKAPKKDQKA